VISGYLDPPSGDRLPLVRVYLFLPSIATSWVPVSFLIDTGAATTCLHPADAIAHVGIDAQLLAQPHLWPQQRAMHGVGGASLYYQVPALYGFRHDEGRHQMLTGTIEIAQPQPHNAGYPSLLGRDVLRQFRVITDWPAAQVTLA
jgi:hypothetical protein